MKPIDMIVNTRRSVGRTGALTGEPMHRIDAYRMICRRSVEVGLKQKLGCHVFRVTSISVYLDGRHARKSTGHGGARKFAHDEILQSYGMITLDEI